LPDRTVYRAWWQYKHLQPPPISLSLLAWLTLGSVVHKDVAINHGEIRRVPDSANVFAVIVCDDPRGNLACLNLLTIPLDCVEALRLQ
jgi:hypothetical protein